MQLEYVTHTFATTWNKLPPYDALSKKEKYKLEYDARQPRLP